MPTILRRTTSTGKTTYQAQVRVKGFPAQVKTFSRLSDARDWAEKLDRAIREGRDFPERTARRRTLLELVNAYTDNPKSEVRNPAFGDLAPREQQRRVRQLLWWVKILHNPTLDQLTPAAVADARDRLRRGESSSGREVTNATARRYLASLSVACNWARRRGWLTRNPVSIVEKGQESPPRVRFLSDDERRRLLEACRKSSDPRLYPIVLMALSTGARQGEIMALRWRDVDLKAGRATLEKTKNRERRALHLSPELVKILKKDLGKVRPIKGGYIFSPAGAEVEPTFPEDAWQAARAAAGLAGDGPDAFRFHDLRHTFASYLAMTGATLADLAEALGHKTLAMVKRYAHLTEGHTSKAVARMHREYLET